MDTAQGGQHDTRTFAPSCGPAPSRQALPGAFAPPQPVDSQADWKSTRLNSSHGYISYAVFCLKKKTHAHVTVNHLTANIASYNAKADDHVAITDNTKPNYLARNIVDLTQSFPVTD